MYFFFYIFEGWSVVKLTGLKLTGSVFFIGFFRIHFRLMVGRDVDGPGSLSRPLWVVQGRPQGLCGWSWVALKASVGGPGSPSVKASVGGLGPRSGRKVAQARARAGSRAGPRTVRKRRKLRRTGSARSPVPIFPGKGGGPGFSLSGSLVPGVVLQRLGGFSLHKNRGTQLLPRQK